MRPSTAAPQHDVSRMKEKIDYCAANVRIRITTSARCSQHIKFKHTFPKDRNGITTVKTVS